MTNSLLTLPALLMTLAAPDLQDAASRSPEAQTPEAQTPEGQIPIVDDSIRLRLDNGEAIRGKFVSLEDNVVTLEVAVLSKGLQVTHELDDFLPESAFRVLIAANKPDDYDSHFEMARKAVKMGLLAQAGAESRAALEAARNDEQFVEKEQAVRAWAADVLEKMTRSAVARDDLGEAQHCVKLLSTRFPDQRSEAQLDAIADVVDSLEQRHGEEGDDDDPSRETIDERLEPVVAGVARADELYREALRKSGSTVEAKNLCERAIRYYEGAFDNLTELLDKYPDDDHLNRRAMKLAKKMHRHAIRASLHAANMLTVQSDYRGAAEWANQVLAYDTDNDEAREMLRTIALSRAASSQWAWGWRTVPGGVDPRQLQPVRRKDQ